MHIHHISPAAPPSRTQQTAASTPTFSLSGATDISGSATASTLASATPDASASTAAASANAASPFASMASNLQSILLGASQAAGGATSLASQAAGAYGLTGSLLG